MTVATAPRDAPTCDLSVVIVSYNVRDFLAQALASVERASAGLDVEVWVVDNDSADGTVEHVRERFPRVRVIANRENVGFARANNQAIRQARGRHILVLNPDTIVREDTLSTLVGYLDAHPDVGAVGPAILNPDGSFAPESRRAFPTPAVAFWRMTGLSRLFPRSRTFGRYNLTYLPRDEEAEVDALSGSCMMVRRRALYERGPCGPKVPGSVGTSVGEHADRVPAPPPTHAPTPRGAGHFDEAFFMYGEDLDWCYRIQAAGWRVCYTPTTQIVHYKGESTKKGDLRYVKLFYGAMLRFADKHFQGRYSRVFSLALRLAIVLRGALSGLAMAARRLRGPALDAGVAAVAAAAVGAARMVPFGHALQLRYFTVVVPLYALGTVLGVALLGGYRSRRARMRPAALGALGGVAMAATASFFVKAIAFSRLAVALALLPTAVALAALRFRRQRAHGPRRAAFVGTPDEAARLARRLSLQPRPPFRLLGRISPSDAPDGPRLGVFRHVRELGRLHALDEIVVSAASVPNGAIFDAMQALHPGVEVRILTDAGEHTIGKASVEPLALTPAGDVLGSGRSLAARRAFEFAAGSLLGLAWPLAAACGRLGHDGCGRLHARLRRLPDVFAGRVPLVGLDPARPPEHGLVPGVFALSEGLGGEDPEARLWYYLQHQSAALDSEIILRALGALWHGR